jgi:hypothetical protein
MARKDGTKSRSCKSARQETKKDDESVKAKVEVEVESGKVWVSIEHSNQPCFASSLGIVPSTAG